MPAKGLVMLPPAVYGENASQIRRQIAAAQRGGKSKFQFILL